VKCKTILKGFSLRINISLLATAIIFAAISSLYDKETLRITCIVIGWLLTLVAVGPSSFGFVLERVRKGNGRYVKDPNIVIPEWKQFYQSMGIEEDIKIKVFPNLRNAYLDGTTIEIGQPILDSLDSLSIKAVFAHELGHIKINYAYKLKHLLVIILVGVVLATLWWLVFAYSVGPLGIFIYSALLIITIGFMGIVMRLISWPDEYKADLIAKQYVSREAVVSFLTAMAALRKMDVTRDFYRHPSITKRIANLDWPKKTRFKKWYFEL
jgi:Zn-dependent protease with chaperone function